MVIYVLKDPRTLAVRYVGKAVNLKRRLANHIIPSIKNKTCHRARWIASLLFLGLKPIAEVIEEIDALDSMNERERFWIAFYREQGCELTNTTDGGEGGATQRGVKRPSWIMKKANAASVVSKRLTGWKPEPVSDVIRRKISEGQRKAWQRQRESGVLTRIIGHTPETKARISRANAGRKPSPLAIQRSLEARGIR